MLLIKYIENHIKYKKNKFLMCLLNLFHAGKLFFF